MLKESQTQFPSNTDSVLGPLPHPPKKGSKENFRLGATEDVLVKYV